MEKVRIEVIGEPGSGKSTICRIIELALHQEGFSSVRCQVQLSPSFYETDKQNTRINSIKDNEIKIVEKQL